MNVFSDHDKIPCICEGRNIACSECDGRGYIDSNNIYKNTVLPKTDKREIDVLQKDKKRLQRCFHKYEYLVNSIPNINKIKENIELALYLKRELISLENDLQKIKHISDLKRDITDILHKIIELRSDMHTKYSGLVEIWAINHKIKNAYKKIISPPEPRLRKLPKSALLPKKKKAKKRKKGKKKK